MLKKHMRFVSTVGDKSGSVRAKPDLLILTARSFAVAVEKFADCGQFFGARRLHCYEECSSGRKTGEFFRPLTRFDCQARR